MAAIHLIVADETASLDEGIASGVQETRRFGC
jgi:hypothetical protein